MTDETESKTWEHTQRKEKIQLVTINFLILSNFENKEKVIALSNENRDVKIILVYKLKLK